MWNSQKAFFLDWLIFIFDSRLGLIFIRYHKYASKIKFIYAFLVATFTCSICLVQDSSEHVAYQFQPHFATIIVVCPRHGMSHLALAGLVMKILQAQAWANIPKYYSQAVPRFRTLSKNVYDWKNPRKKSNILCLMIDYRLESVIGLCWVLYCIELEK